MAKGILLELLVNSLAAWRSSLGFDNRQGNTSLGEDFYLLFRIGSAQSSAVVSDYERLLLSRQTSES